MRTLLLAAAFAVVTTGGAATAHGSTPDRPCQARLPRGPQVPAPLVFSSRCGRFRMETDGRVSRLPRHWLVHEGGGTGRRFGAHVRLRTTREGHLVLRGDTVWRSAGVYRNDITSVAFGPRLFAFSSYPRGVYITDLRSPERLVVRGRGAYTYEFTGSGMLLVLRGRTIVVVSSDGTQVRRSSFSRQRGVAFDPESDTLYFVTPGNELVTLRDARIRRVADVSDIDGSLTLTDPDLLVWGAAHGITVTTRAGEVVASARWQPKLGSADLGVRSSRDGKLFSFRVSTASPGRRNVGARLFVLRRGSHVAQELYRHTYAQVGCGVAGGLSWHRHDLLYDSGQGKAVIFEPDGGSRPVSLAGVARGLPKLGSNDIARAAWVTDFAR
jgi:hypothetical protein